MCECVCVSVCVSGVIKKKKEGPRHVMLQCIYAQLQTDLPKQIFLF